MAAKLTECPACKARVSADAKVCPRCGKKNPGNQTGCVAGGCATVLVLGALLWVIGLFTGSPEGSRATAPPAPAVRVGAKLYDSGGQLWGTVVAVVPKHRFPNGRVEPGMQVDYGPRMNDSPVPPQWLPQRAADRFRVE
jgi:hypothetical protein